MAKQVGKPFKSQRLDVWNLILDKHHTIYANNIVSATLGKWDSIEHFLYQKNNRFNMIEMEDGPNFEPGTGEGNPNLNTNTPPPNSNAYVSENEVIVRDVPPTMDLPFIEENLFIAQEQGVKYADEQIKRKEAKKAAGAGA